MEKKFRGRALKLGNNVDTEQIIPSRYCTSLRPEDIVPHALEGADPTFRTRMKKGDIIVAGANFGCGSAREVAALAIKWTGAAAVVAESFSRIFFRNSVNVGLPILEAFGVYAGIADGDMVEVDLDQGLIRNITKMRNFHSTPFPDLMQTLVQAGGLEEYVRQRLKRKGPT